MIILGIDTSASDGGVALCRDEETLTEATMKSPLRHAEELLPIVSRVLNDLEMGISDVDLVSVNSGPGSFTGLRIGLATAKGICQASGIPLVGVDGWTMYRERLSRAEEARVCIVIENRRDLYYAQWLSRGSLLHDAEVISGDEIVERVCAEKRRVLVIGSGALALRERLAKCAHAECAQDEANRQSAADIARIGMRIFSQDRLYDLEPAYVEPVLARMKKQS